MPDDFFTRPSTRTASLMILGSALICQLSGCSVSDQDLPRTIAKTESVIPENWHESDMPSAATTSDQALALTNWWAQFHDPILADLVARSLAANTDYATALGHLRTARATVKQTEASLLPDITTSNSETQTNTLSRPHSSSSSYSLGLDASWQIDIFGSIRGQVAASKADLASSKASLFDVQRTVEANIATNYINLRDAQARLIIAENNIQAQKDNLDLVNWSYMAGTDSALDLEQAKTLLAQTEAGVPPLRQSIQTAINEIDILLGQAPGTNAALLEPVKPLPEAPSVIGPGLPAELLARRPDVLSARHTLESETIRIGVAEAAMYPSLNLTGTLSTFSPTTANLFASVASSVITGISAPIFDGGAIHAQIEEQRGSADVALAAYHSAIITALQDTENALVSVKTARDTEVALARAEESAEESERLARIQYKAGSINFQSFIDTQKNVLSAQDSHESAKASKSTAAVQLFNALGGGWPAPSTTQERATK